MGNKKVQGFLYGKESYLIRGACYEVWDALRGVFKEKAIEVALKKEMASRGLRVETQKRIPLLYKGEIIGNYAPDFIVEDKIIVELKAKPYVSQQDERQF